MDAVHKLRTEDGDGCGGGTSAHPRREEITDTMIFSPSDLITMTCRDVDLNYATRGMYACTFNLWSVASNASFNIDLIWSGVDWLRLSLYVCRHLYRLGDQLVQSKRWSPREGAAEVGWWRQQRRELRSRYRCSELKNNMHAEISPALWKESIESCRTTRVMLLLMKELLVQLIGPSGVTSRSKWKEFLILWAFGRWFAFISFIQLILTLN